MALTVETAALLDKLYNLRGEDSAILKEMDKEKENALETKEKTSKEKVLLQEKITELLAEESVLAEQGTKLLDALSGIDSQEFSEVLDKLNISFNPSELKEKVAQALPGTIDKVVEDTKKAESELVSVENEMNNAITTIEELGIRKDAALSNQAKLNEYFDLALNGNINITRDSITSLLEQFDFDEIEQREAAKIMMFPEDSLYEYDAKAKELDSPGKSISEVIAEARGYQPEEPVTAVEPQIEVIVPEEPKPIVENVDLSKKDRLINAMTANGLDYLDYTNNDLNKILENYDEEVLKNNINVAKNNGMDLDLFSDNIALLYDKEFVAKVERLISVGKSPLDIYLNPNVLIKYSLDNLNSTISLLENNGLDPRKVPLMAY